MKKVLLSCAACLLAIGLVTACNDDVEIEDDNTVNEPSTNDPGTTTDPGTSNTPKTYDHYVLVGDFVDVSWDKDVTSESPYYLAANEDSSENHWTVTVTMADEPDYGEWDPWNAGLRVVAGTSDSSWVTIAGYSALDSANSTGVVGEGSDNNIAVEWNKSYDVIIDLTGESPSITVSVETFHIELAEDVVTGEEYYLGYTDENGVSKYLSFDLENTEFELLGDEDDYVDDTDEDNPTYYPYYYASYVDVTLTEDYEKATPVYPYVDDNDIVIRVGSESLYLYIPYEDDYDDEEGDPHGLALVYAEDEDVNDIWSSDFDADIWLEIWQDYIIGCDAEADDFVLVVNSDEKVVFEYAEDYSVYADEVEGSRVWFYELTSDWNYHYEPLTEVEDGESYYLGYVEDNEAELLKATGRSYSSSSAELSLTGSYKGASSFTTTMVEGGYTISTVSAGKVYYFASYSFTPIKEDDEETTLEVVNIDSDGHITRLHEVYVSGDDEEDETTIVTETLAADVDYANNNVHLSFVDSITSANSYPLSFLVRVRDY